MGPDPQYERRGAASMMVRWGLDQCKIHDAPGHLDSTLEAGSFYKKMGFAALKKISFQCSVEGQNEYELYEEIAFIYCPVLI